MAQALQSTVQGGCPHAKKSRVCFCGICIRCPNDICNESHPSSDPNRLVSQALAQSRALAKQAVVEERPSRDATRNVGSLNIDLLAQPIESVLNDIKTEEAESSSFLVLKLAKLLNMADEVSDKALNRKSSYSLESLRNPATLTEGRRACVQFVRAIIGSVTDSPEAAKVLEEACAIKMQPPKVVYGDVPVQILADVFVRAIGENQRNLERERFALLVAATEGVGLEDTLMKAVQRAIDDEEFMANARGRKYSRTRVSALSDSAPPAITVAIDEDDQSVPDDLVHLDDPADATPTPPLPTLTGSAPTPPETRKSISVSLSVPDLLNLKIRWSRSPIRLARAVDDYDLLRTSKPLPKLWSCPRVGLESIRACLRFLEDISLGWKGGATQTVCVGDSTIKDMPYLNMSINKIEAWNEYDALSKKGGGTVQGYKRVGYESFSTLYDGLSRLIEQKHALSYYFTEAMQAAVALGEMVNRIENLWTQHHVATSPPEHFHDFTVLPAKFQTLRDALAQCTHHLKYGIRSHLEVTSCDGSALHCARFAVGNPCGQSMHTLGECVECTNFVKIPDAVRALMNAVMNSLAREHEGETEFARSTQGGPVNELDSMASPITSCMRSLNYYHKHVVRGLWQSAAVSDILKNLKVGEVLATIDHKQKLEQVNFNESSAEYFGKKGMSLLGVAIRYRLVSGGPIFTKFIDTICLNSNQDGNQVQAILSLVVPIIKELVPSTTRVILLSDNGAAFTSKENMKFVWRQNQQAWGAGLQVVRWVFFEAQCGKTILDTHFAYLGILIKRFARKVRAVKQHQDVFDALKDGDGIANTTTLLVNIPGASDEDVAAVAEAESQSVEISGIRKVHHIEFDEKVNTFMYSNVERGKETYDFSKEVKPLPPSAVLMERYDSTKLSQLSGTTNTSAAVASSSSSAGGPQVRRSQFVSPHQERMIEEMTVMATQSQQVTPTPLLSNAVTPVTSHVATSSTSPVQVEDSRISFTVGWGDAITRRTTPMNDSLVAELKKMVRLHSVERWVHVLTLCSSLVPGRRENRIKTFACNGDRVPFTARRRQAQLDRQVYVHRASCEEALRQVDKGEKRQAETGSDGSIGQCGGGRDGNDSG